VRSLHVTDVYLLAAPLLLSSCAREPAPDISCALPAAGPVRRDTFAKPHSPGQQIMGEQHIADQWWDVKTRRWLPAMGYQGLLDADMNLDIIFESHAEIETQLRK
jgi:hypothetical protein